MPKENTYLSAEDIAIAEKLKDAINRVRRYVRVNPLDDASSPRSYVISQEHATRLLEIIRLRKEGKTYKEIAIALGGKITYQRVRQIVARFSPDLRFYKRPSRVTIYTHVCKRCKVEFKSKLKRQIHCSRAHRLATPEERKARLVRSLAHWAAHHKNKLATDPEYKARCYARNREYTKDYWRNLPPEERARRIAKRKAWLEEKRKDPAFLEQERAGYRARYRLNQEKRLAKMQALMPKAKLKYENGRLISEE